MDLTQVMHFAEQYVPMVAMATGHPAEKRPLATRLTEQAFVGIVAAVVAVWIAQRDAAHDVSELRKDFLRLEATVAAMATMQHEQIRLATEMTAVREQLRRIENTLEGRKR